MKLLVSALIVLLLVARGMGNAQEMTPTLARIPPYSIFSDDTCSAPCWFGLTPGESTSSDVEAMFQQNEDVFGFQRDHVDASISQDELVADGWYSLYWSYRTQRQRIPTLIRMVDGLVYYIGVQAQHPTHLLQFLDIYEKPDYVWIRITGFCNLYLLYSEQRIVADFRTDLMDGQPSSGIINDDYDFIELTYYSPQAAIGIEERFPSNALSSLLNPSGITNFRQVPLETWQSWLGRDNIYPCSDVAWESLPSEIETPIYPTLTPTAITSK